MSVLIKGMEMPKSCEQCEMFNLVKSINDFKCCANDEWHEADFDYHNKRHPDYPIVEIPTPHGRLIDADALVNRIKNNYCNKCTTVEECGICVCQNCGVATLFDEIENAPTIIEAEVGK